MAQLDPVLQLRTWLEEQIHPVPTRADKIVRWCVRRVPGVKTFVTSFTIRAWMPVAMFNVILGFNFLAHSLSPQAHLIACCVTGVLALPTVIALVANLSSSDFFDNFTDVPDKDLAVVRKKIHRVQTYHPELVTTLTEVWNVLERTASLGSASKLNSILNDILLYQPVKIVVHGHDGEHPSVKSVVGAASRRPMKNLIHYPELRALATAADAATQRLQTPTWVQTIFSPSFLKSSKLKNLIDIVNTAAVCGWGIIFFIIAYLYGVLWSGVSFISACGLVTSLSYIERHWLLCLDEEKANLIQKLQKIALLYPQSNELINPIFVLLKQNMCLHSVDQLDAACSAILINMEDERITSLDGVEVQHAMPAEPTQHQSSFQRLIL